MDSTDLWAMFGEIDHALILFPVKTREYSNIIYGKKSWESLFYTAEQTRKPFIKLFTFILNDNFMWNLHENKKIELEMEAT